MINLPPVSATHLVQYLFEVGPTFPGAMGSVGLPFSEIESWQRQTGIELSPWEVRTLQMASVEYAHQSMLSIKPDCPSPGSIVAIDREQVAKHVRSILRS